MKWRILLYLTIGSHMLVVLGNLASLFALPFVAPWYVAFPCCSFVVLVSFSREIVCPLTRLENGLRQKLNLPPIKGFISHYLVKPARKLLAPIKSP
jgi:hypothetical protein